MFFSEDRIDREVHWAGFGFQAWLQIQTHLRRSTENGLLIIDEPDVYLHPDLQKRLLTDIRRRFPQYIMATHAIEMINDADASEVVTINNKYQSAKRIRSDEDYAAVYRYIGSGENAAFARLAKAKKVIFVEGDDEKLIRKMARHLGLQHLADPQNVPIIKLGGFSEWRRAKDAAWAIGSVLDLDIEIKCLFDRDYRSAREVEDLTSQISEENISCHIWKQKEIENFLIVPQAIYKAVKGRAASRPQSEIQLTKVLVDELIRSTAEEFVGFVSAQLMAHELRYSKRTDPRIDESSVLQRVAKEFAEDSADLPKLLAKIPGKEFFSLFNKNLREVCSISISEFAVVDALEAAWIAPDFHAILKDLNEFAAK